MLRHLLDANRIACHHLTTVIALDGGVLSIHSKQEHMTWPHHLSLSPNATASAVCTASLSATRQANADTPPCLILLAHNLAPLVWLGFSLHSYCYHCYDSSRLYNWSLHTLYKHTVYVAAAHASNTPVLNQHSLSQQKQAPHHAKPIDATDHMPPPSSCARMMHAVRLL